MVGPLREDVGGWGGGGVLEGQVAYLGRELKEQVVEGGWLGLSLEGRGEGWGGLEVAKEGR